MSPGAPQALQGMLLSSASTCPTVPALPLCDATNPRASTRPLALVAPRAPDSNIRPGPSTSPLGHLTGTSTRTFLKSPDYPAPKSIPFSVFPAWSVSCVVSLLGTRDCTVPYPHALFTSKSRGSPTTQSRPFAATSAVQAEGGRPLLLPRHHCHCHRLHGDPGAQQGASGAGEGLSPSCVASSLSLTFPAPPPVSLRLRSP